MGKYVTPVQDHLILLARVSLTVGEAEALRLVGRPVPPALDVRLLIDTGSKRSSLIPAVIAQLLPFRVGKARIETSLAAGRTSLFWVRLEFPGTALIPVSRIVVADLTLPPTLAGFHGVIGRDLLGQWDSFHYQGRRRRLIIRDTPGGLFRWLRR